MVVLGITGGIGSGKSYISSLLQSHLNVPVYDCDTEAKRLMNEDKSIQQQLKKLVGAHVYKDGKLQKDVLADYLFANQQNAQQVNAIVHPAVREDFDKWARRQNTDVVAIESAILFESGFDTLTDKVLFVDAPMEVRIQRVIKRDDCTRQQKCDKYRHKASLILENNDYPKELLLAALQVVLKDINLIRYN